MIAFVRRWIELRRYARQLETNLAARKRARMLGTVFVGSYTRRK